jgi:hypothetical protein
MQVPFAAARVGATLRCEKMGGPVRSPTRRFGPFSYGALPIHARHDEDPFQGTRFSTLMSCARSCAPI